MVDIVSPQKRSRMMAGIRGTDTKPEHIVRKALHGAGLRFRLHRKDLAGRPDVVMPRFNLVLFVNGCFWHGHEDCHLFRLPRTRTEFWEAKIGGNRQRDARNTEMLAGQGWRVGVIWECAIKGRMASKRDNFTSQLVALVRSKEIYFDLRGVQVEQK